MLNQWKMKRGNCIDCRYVEDHLDELDVPGVEPIPLSGVATSQSFGSRERLGVRSTRSIDACVASLFSLFCFGRLLK